jgi:hypothetical protein
LVATLLDPGGAGGGAGGAASGAADGDRAPATAGATLDPARVRRHLLAPLAHRAGFPGFRSDYIAAALHAERRAGFLAEVLGAFGDLPVLRLKGIAYIATLYDDPAERPMTDIDLLVPGPRFAGGGRPARALGYVDDGKRNQRSPVNHAVTLRRRESAIDLHRSMVQVGRMAIDLDAVWRNAIPACQTAAWCPCPDHEYLIHLAHMARHEFACRADRLRRRRPPGRPPVGDHPRPGPGIWPGPPAPRGLPRRSGRIRRLELAARFLGPASCSGVSRRRAGSSSCASWRSMTPRATSSAWPGAGLRTRLGV